MKENQLLKFLKSRYFWIQIFSGIAVVILLFFIFLKSLDMITRHGEELSVPKFTGLTLDKAIQVAGSMKFKLKIDSIFIPDKSGGEIVDQSPNYGDLVKSERTIYLTIVKNSAPLVKLPNYEDIPYKEFESNLIGLGLKVDSIEYKPDIAKDLVLGVHYKGGKISEGFTLAKGSKVDLILGDGLGQNLVPLPNLIGLKLDEAKFAIRGSQLLLGKVTFTGTITDSGMVKVLKQFPPQRTDSLSQISQGSQISLEVGQIP